MKVSDMAQYKILNNYCFLVILNSAYLYPQFEVSKLIKKLSIQINMLILLKQLIRENCYLNLQTKNAARKTRRILSIAVMI